MSYRGVIPHMFAEHARQKARRLRGAKALGIGTAVPLAAYGGARASGFTNEQIASAIGAGADKVLPENFYYPDENAEHSYFFGSRSVERKSPYRNGQKPAGNPFPQLFPDDYWFMEPFAGLRMIYDRYYKGKQRPSMQTASTVKPAPVIGGGVGSRVPDAFYPPNRNTEHSPFYGSRSVERVSPYRRSAITDELFKGSAANYDNVTAQMNGDLSATRARRLASCLFKRV